MNTNARVCAYVGLGTNLGDGATTLRTAATELAATPGVDGVRLSPFYRSAPVDATGPDFINAVAGLDTALTSLDLLGVLQALEHRHGRQRSYKNAPRTLDLDLLLYGSLSLNSPRLVLPHPRMHERAFVLRPLHDLAPDLALPQGNWHALLARVDDQVIERLA